MIVTSQYAETQLGIKCSSDELIAQFVQMTQHWCYIHLLNMTITFTSFN